VPKHAKKMKNKSAAQEIRFFGKIGFIKHQTVCLNVPKKLKINPLPNKLEKFLKLKEIRFFGKIGFLLKKQNL
jgi:hypothetical protein